MGKAVGGTESASPSREGSPAGAAIGLRSAERGATSLEYSMLMALVLLAAVIGGLAFSDSVLTIVESNAQAITEVAPGSTSTSVADTTSTSTTTTTTPTTTTTVSATTTTGGGSGGGGVPVDVGSTTTTTTTVDSTSSTTSLGSISPGTTVVASG